MFSHRSDVVSFCQPTCLMKTPERAIRVLNRTTNMALARILPGFCLAHHSFLLATTDRCILRLPRLGNTGSTNHWDGVLKKY
ncbi:hypothetical protein CY34DRAFT_325973 [Suillus luteus UH-Slu-Lm8-n1]|uniref:Uncharacterized protein n=1 Tax=Suillus luteus UH-Slu-Lm8-n1 TaxID=930992 RepID=A0A0D0B6W6_9AGAM|nr:hypothetical protein CY34DRAFT_325973 [Suillus luteus UH-Slu-Lm8-n1]